MNQIRIPFGMRDILLDECTAKKQLQDRIEQVFRSYGYREIETPTLEFYQTYENAFADAQGDFDDREMVKVIDQDGKILAMRMDMTVPIARVCASKFSKIDPPYRLRYCSSVYKMRQAFAGKRSEVSDCGVELIGLDSQHDIEVLCCALDTMAAFGLEDYQLEIGNSDFFKQACRTLNLNNVQTKTLADLIDRKSMVELQDYVAGLQISDQASTFFIELPMLGGQPDVLNKALAYCFNDELRQEVDSLLHIYDALKELGYADHVTFDLGKVPHLDYYTGIIFEGFVPGVGHSVLSGGRYDQLLNKFGRDLPACGFGVKLDYLTEVMTPEPEPTVTLYYPLSKQVEALKLARELRKKQPVKMVVRENGDVEVSK
ncbi:MAG: ATP phosphoribosyltransferase regulatory subunit [Catenisphaera adipataccumulans]|jgi:ATP phosphoribosyltransferase regulatory subunit|uniref:ATP phosphoribosyltransferase regulatory subunit n=1 Tax=Catenisphaera adipataccumulans TaxID=700500 RepID=UPI003D903424